MFKFKFPAISEITIVRLSDLREAGLEVFVTLLFSLMPLWLGFLITKLLILPGAGPTFLERFASSSDLGIISSAFLGPLLYVILREDGPLLGARKSARFPNSLSYVIGIFLCSLIATVIYSFTYLSSVQMFFDKTGKVVSFINRNFVEQISIALLFVSVFLIFSFSAVRNAIGRLGESYQEQVAGEVDVLSEQLRRAESGEHESAT